MKRASIALAALLSLAAGCGKSDPPGQEPVAQPAADSPDVAPASSSNRAAETAAPAKPTDAQTAAPASVPPPTADKALDELRALSAKLVERDPAGGWRISEAAALELEKQVADADAKLLPLLADPSIDVRRGAAFYLLGRFNPASTDQVAAFSKLLEDSDQTVRGIGLSAVKQMRESDVAAAAPRLVTMLDPVREPQADNRAAIARMLGKLKSQAASATGELIEAAANDPAAQVRGACLVAISQIATPDGAIPAYRQGLSDADAAVRLVAAARLRQLGPAAAPARQELGKALEDADERVANAAAETLLLIGPPAVTTLVKSLDAQAPAARKLALACLAKLGPVAKAAIPEIEKRLKDDDAEARKLAEIALARIQGK